MESSNQGWVFGPSGDLFSFFSPALFALLFGYFHLIEFDGLIAVIWFSSFINNGHQLATYVAIQKVGSRDIRLALLPLFIFTFAISFVALTHSARAFILLAAYTGIFHTTRQHYGWLRLAQKQSTPDSSKINWYECFVFWILILYPLLYLHSANSPWGPEFYTKDDLLHPFISVVAIDFLHLAYWVVIMTYLFFSAYRYKSRAGPHWGRLFFMLMTWIYFYLSICVLKNKIMFGIAISSAHGLSYHFFIYRKYIAAEGHYFIKQMITPLIYFSGFCVLGFIGHYGHGFLNLGTSEMDLNLPIKLGVALLAALTMLHYLLDTIIWRSKESILLHGFKHKPSAN